MHTPYLDTLPGRLDKDRPVEINHQQKNTFVHVQRFRFEFDLTRQRLPTGLTGSAWRGTVGQVMLQPIPGKALPETHNCEGRCAYCALLRPQRNVHRKGKLVRVDVPRPMIIGARMYPNPLRKNAFYLNVTLLGQAIKYLPELIDAFARAGDRGIGAGQSKFRLASVEFEQDLGANCWSKLSEYAGVTNESYITNYNVPQAKNLIRFELKSPLRIVRNNKPRLDPSRFKFEDFFSTASRRVTNLTMHHANHQIADDFIQMTHAAKSIPLRLAQLHQVKHSRFSSRQKENLKLDGLIGEFYLDADQVQPHWPYLWFAQWLNIGKGSVMGLGEYETHV